MILPKIQFPFMGFFFFKTACIFEGKKFEKLSFAYEILHGNYKTTLYGHEAKISSLLKFDCYP
jgi:hypothetical protein